MDKAYDPKLVEEKIYQMWEAGSPRYAGEAGSPRYSGEAGGYFKPEIAQRSDLKRPQGLTSMKQHPFTIILPPPNANADLHLGHAMYTIEDIMTRYHRMKGDPTLWLPGADHAGFETQYVFERDLAREGKSRFDYAREELYQKIWDFVHTNRGKMEMQLRRLGFSLDWSRNIFTLDPKIVAIVYQTFKKLFTAGLVYRGTRLVNYCTHCGTGFSDLEVKHVEQKDPLYFIKYGPFTLATVRPETKFGDTAIAVNPHDKRYKQWVGKEVEVEGLLGKFKIKVIADAAIDPKFGTGVAKVTPAHDMTDFEIGQRHNLEMKQVIGLDGRLTDLAGPYAGLKIKAARAKVAADLATKGLLGHVDENYLHTVATCYKCGTVLEPLPMSQWFIKIRPLAEAAIATIKDKRIMFVPKRFEKHALQWLTNFHDWNISRQVVWGIRIPAWKCLDCANRPASPAGGQHTTDNKQQFNNITMKQSGWIVTEGSKPDKCPVCQGTNLEQDSDTFDTWFSSGQWPFATLKASPYKGDFDYFYPTSVMETGYDILPWWVCRMIMLGLYVTGDVPFRTVYLHGLVRDATGQKMSKSKGNVINPIEMAEKYGADALRLALVFGTAAGNDQSLSEDKIRGMRNFTNKLWNIGRFINLQLTTHNLQQVPFYDEKMHKTLKNSEDKRIVSELNMLSAAVSKNLESYRLSDAAQAVYDFAWHRLADVHLEKNKKRFKNGDLEALAVLRHVFLTILKLLHPFMPFITEELWSKIPRKYTDPLIVSRWPV